MDGKLAACRIGREIGVPVVADLEWTEDPRLEEFLGLIHHVIVSLHFAAEVTGAADPRQAASVLHGGTRGGHGGDLRSKRLLVRHGIKGRGKPLPGPALQGGRDDRVRRRVSRSLRGGAGAGRSRPRGIELATAAAAVYASRPSGWDYLPTHGECETP